MIYLSVALWPVAQLMQEVGRVELFGAGEVSQLMELAHLHVVPHDARQVAEFQIHRST